MNIKFNISTELNSNEVIEKAKLVLFHSMVKMHELATMNAPVDKGFLRASIKLFPSHPGATFYELADGVTYGIDVEFGTVPHVIRAKTGKALKFKIGSKDIFAKSVRHPGTTAQPFFRPALDQVKNVWVKRYWNKYLAK